MNVKRVLPIVLIVFLALACHKDNGPCLTCPPPYVPRLSLTAEDVGATDARLHAGSTASPLGRTATSLDKKGKN